MGWACWPVEDSRTASGWKDEKRKRRKKIGGFAVRIREQKELMYLHLQILSQTVVCRGSPKDCAWPEETSLGPPHSITLYISKFKSKASSNWVGKRLWIHIVYSTQCTRVCWYLSMFSLVPPSSKVPAARLLMKNYRCKVWLCAWVSLALLEIHLFHPYCTSHKFLFFENYYSRDAECGVLWAKSVSVCIICHKS